MKRLLSALLCLLTLTGSAQDTEFFIPVHQNALRLPAVPLITVDPYFCLWSKYDHLYDGSVTHWSGVKKPLNGAAYVDGTAYRFMGESLESIYPVAAEKAWTGTQRRGRLLDARLRQAVHRRQPHRNIRVF